MDLPDFLIEQARRGQVVLFLGAGASYGSLNQLGESPPLGESLADQLSSQAGLNFDREEDDLSTVAANAKIRLGDDAYYRFLRERYLHCQPSAALLQLSQFPWQRIYTLNIDDAVEAAYAKSDYSVEVSVCGSPVSDKSQDARIVQLIHLNGSVDRLEAGLIFTPAEYAGYAGKYANWYERSAQDFQRFTFLFVGTKLNEPLFRHHIDRLVAQTGHRPGTAYVVSPTFSDNRAMQLRAQNIEPLVGGVEDLASGLVAKLGKHVTINEMLRLQHPNLQQLIAKIPRAQLEEIAGQLDQLELVDPEQLKKTIPPAPNGVRNFYYGSEPTWRDVIDGVPAETSGFRELISAAEGTSAIVLLHGPAGSGKTTALMMAAYALAIARPHAFVIWVRGVADFPKAAIEKLATSGVDEVVVVVDDFAVHAADLLDLDKKAIKSLRLIIADRSNLVPPVRSDYHVPPSRSVALRKLSGSDIDLVLSKLQAFGPWDRLGRMSLSSRRNALEKVAEKQLLVGLREATQGVGFDRIAASEFEKINGEYARCAYLIVAVASMHRLEMSTATFDIAIKEMLSSNAEISRSRLSGLEEIVLHSGGWLRIRHQILAEFTMSQVAPRSEVLKAVLAVMASLSRYPSPLRWSANKAEQRLFAAITNHEFLWRLFRSQKEAVLSNFAAWERHFGNDGLFWLQYALFEQACGPRYLNDAVNHIRTAMRIFPQSHQILNAYANIHFSLALNASRPEEGLMLMEQATESIIGQAAYKLTEAYTAVALAKGRVSVIRKWYPDRLKDELREAEQRLRQANENDPGNFSIQDALNQLHLGAVGRRGGARRKPRRRK